MRRSDAHLEQALQEYNDRISYLETKKGMEELYLEALVNRSSILMMMEHYTSAVEDTEDAISLTEEMRNAGMKVDIGTYIKMYDNHGQMMYDSDNKAMASDYQRISDAIMDVDKDVRHYTVTDLMELCIGCAEDLIDADMPDEALPFLLKAFSLLGTARDPRSLNQRFVVVNDMAAVDIAKGMDECAVGLLDDAISIGLPLYGSDELDDPLELVNTYVAKGDIMERKGDDRAMWDEHENAIGILIKLHQGLAESMMRSGEIQQAEKHLMRSMTLGVPGMKDAIDTLNDMQ